MKTLIILLVATMIYVPNTTQSQQGVISGSLSITQSGALKGKVTDGETDEEIPFANVMAMIGDSVIWSTYSDFDGYYTIKPINPGTYEVVVRYVGYTTNTTKNVLIKTSQTTYLNIGLTLEGIMLDEVTIVEYVVPVIDAENKTGGTVTSQEIRAAPSRKIHSLVSQVAGVYKTNKGKGTNIKGSRQESTVYYVDGIKVTGSIGLPQSGVEQIPIITGGTPASHGEPLIEKIAIKKIRSGVLTAGEIHDFSKWELWQDISKYDLAKWQEQWKIALTDRYPVQVTTNKGKPVVNCEVHLKSRDGKVLWSARTDNTGKAELWANAFDESFNKRERLSIEATYNGKSSYVEKATKMEQAINIIQFQEICMIPDQVDIAFVVDATGSMGDEINYLKEELKDIILKTKADYSELDINLGSVFYRCLDNSYVTRKSQFSSDLDQIMEFIHLQKADEGGMEAVEEAMSVAINEMDWSENARARLLFLILDEPPGNQDKIISKLKNSIFKASRLGIKVIPVVASGMGHYSDKSLEYLMRSFALATNGTYVFLTDHSGVGSEHAIPTTDEYNVELLKDLMLRLIYQNIYAPPCDELIGLDENGIQDTMFVINPDIIAHVVVDSTLVNDHASVIKNQDTPENIEYINELIENPEIPSEIHRDQFKKLKYYPNPTSGPINIEIDGKVTELFIADISGKLLKRVEVDDSSRISIDISEFPSGIYFLKYLNNDRWLTGKVLLQH